VAEKDDDIERRVGALEGTVQDLTLRVRRSEQDAAAARVLAGGADRDVGELRGETRELRTEMRAGFADVRAEMHAEFADVRAEMHAEFADVRAAAAEFRSQNNRVLNAMREDIIDLREHVDRGFLEIRGRLDATAAGQQTIVDLLGTLISREERGTDG
jgi:hypothetical protein